VCCLLVFVCVCFFGLGWACVGVSGRECRCVSVGVCVCVDI